MDLLISGFFKYHFKICVMYCYSSYIGGNMFKEYFIKAYFYELNLKTLFYMQFHAFQIRTLEASLSFSISLHKPLFSYKLLCKTSKLKAFSFLYKNIFSNNTYFFISNRIYK